MPKKLPVHNQSSAASLRRVRSNNRTDSVWLNLREIIASSRPVSWVNTAIPFAAAYLLSGGSLGSQFFILTAYFLLPYNLLVYGVNDIYDYASDLANPRKGGIEGSIVSPERRRLLWASIIVVNLFGGYFAWATLAFSGRLLFLALIFLAVSYSIKGLRFKEIPLLDSINSSLHFVGPAILGCTIVAQSSSSWLPLIGFFCWGVASHALGAIQDIKPDRAGKIRSIATEWGARATIRFVVVMYGFSVLITAIAFPPVTLLASLLISPFLLNATFFLKYTSDAQSSRFRRAWTNFMWLNGIVGFWLTQWLLWYFDPFSLGAGRVDMLLLACIFFSLLQLCLIAYNLSSFRRPKTTRLDEWPRVSIVIHAYNQAENIASTLLAALGQNYPDYEILFTDLDSDDNTLKIAQSYEDKRLKILSIDPIEPGWSIQSWAADQLLRQASGEYVVFVSADTVLLPNAIAQVASLMETQKLQLLSLLPADQNKSFAQKTILSHNQYLLLAAYPAAYLQNHAPERSTAHGGILALAATPILANGGFETVKASPLEDQELFHRARQMGLRSRLFRGSDLATSQNHQAVRSILADDIQRFYPALRFHFPIAWMLFLGGLVVFSGPAFILAYDVLSGQFQHVSLAIIAILAQLITRAIVAWETKQNIFAQLLSPLMNVLVMGLLLGSLLHYELLKPRWQSRTELV